MNLQTLRYFVSLAEKKSFTKAAKECFVSQPALSRSISEFENKIGCKLVNRSSRVVELTEEGQVCVIEAQKILKQYDILVDKVNNKIRESEEPVRVGYVIYGHIGVFNKRLSQISSKDLMEIEPIYDTLSNMWERLELDKIDMAIVPEVCINNNKLNSLKLLKSQLYILVSNKNKLFNHKFVKFSDLENHRFIGWDPKETPLLSDAHSKICEENGFKPEFISYGKKMGDLMTLCIMHNALGFVAGSSTVVDSEEFKLIPVLDSSYNFGLSCVWKRTNDSSSLKRLVSALGK